MRTLRRIVRNDLLIVGEAVREGVAIRRQQHEVRLTRILARCQVTEPGREVLFLHHARHALHPARFGQDLRQQSRAIRRIQHIHEARAALRHRKHRRIRREVLPEQRFDQPALLQTRVHVDRLRVGHETVIRCDDEGRLLKNARLFRRAHQIRHAIVAVIRRPISLRHLTAVRVLETVQAHEVNRQKVRLLRLQDVHRELRIQVITLRLARIAQLAPLHLLFDRDAQRASLGEQFRRAVFLKQLLLKHIRHRPVERLRAARGRPDHRRRCQPRLLRRVVNRRRFHDLIFVEDRVRDQRDLFPLLPVVILVRQHAMLRRMHARHQCRVIRPRHRRKGALHLLHTHPVRRQFLHRRHVALRIVKIVLRPAIDAHKYDMLRRRCEQ